MNLYLLQRPVEDVEYDEMAGIVIRARNVNRARLLAKAEKGGEDKSVWDKVGCTRLANGVTGDEAVVLKDFRAG